MKNERRGGRGDERFLREKRFVRRCRREEKEEKKKKRKGGRGHDITDGPVDLGERIIRGGERS